MGLPFASTPADHANMAATAAAHHGDGANLRPGDAGTVARIGTGKIATAGMAGALEAPDP